jgi:hypothetical protein
MVNNKDDNDEYVDSSNTNTTDDDNQQQQQHHHDEKTKGESSTASASNNSGIWIGIDLGTSNSACAVWDSSRGGSKWYVQKCNHSFLSTYVCYPPRSFRSDQIRSYVIHLVVLCINNQL